MLLGLDLGTSSIKAVLYDPAKGQITASSAQPTPVSHPQPGWSEHDPEQIWKTVCACIRSVANGQPVDALAISSMAESGVLIDEKGSPLAPIIAWYDRRSEPQAAWIEKQVSLSDIFRITGQRPSPSFGLTKILWMKENMPAEFARGAKWLPLPSYLYWRFTGRFVVDFSIASRTLAFDQHLLSWSSTMLAAAGVSQNLFPEALPGASPAGHIRKQASDDTGLASSTLCVLGGHDHLCAAFAAGAYSPGAVTDSTGSANALLMVLPGFINQPGLAEKGFACYPYVINKRFVLKGGLKAAGSGVEWLARLLSGQAESIQYTVLEEEAAAGIGKLAGPLWLPHLIGSGTPEGDRFSRAAMIGVQYEHTRGDVFRGLLESLAFWMRHNLDEMQASSGLEYNDIVLTGGAARLRLLSELKAHVLNRPVLVPDLPEAAAAGAALLAGLGADVFSDPGEAASSLKYNIESIHPDPHLARWYDRLYHQAYQPLYAALQPVHAKNTP